MQLTREDKTTLYSYIDNILEQHFKEYGDEITAYFNDHFINYMVDADTLEGPDLRLIYDIKTIPTLLWLDNKGRVVHKKEGACYHAELIRNAEIALQTKKN